VVDYVADGILPSSAMQVKHIVGISAALGHAGISIPAIQECEWAY
jgi:hypothetical protein